MTEIDPKQQLYTQLGLSRNNTTDKNAKDELGQAEFLELMTTQLKFQDPMKPMENGDFLAQMAQFGTVSGINELNTSFSSMSTALQSNQALQASTMVGRNVLIPGNQSRLSEEGSLRSAVDLESSAQVIVNIKDASGQLIHRMDMGIQQAGLHTIEWNGLNGEGQPASPGMYTVSAEVRQGENVSEGSMLTTVQVESVTLGKAGQDLTLTVSDLGDISMSQVRKIM